MAELDGDYVFVESEAAKFLRSAKAADRLKPYAGKWIALKGESVVDSDTSAGALLGRLKPKGLANVLFSFVSFGPRL